MNAGENELKIAALSARLKARWSELLALSDGARDNRKPVELDQSKVGRLSRMDAMQDQAMAQESAPSLPIRMAEGFARRLSRSP